MPGLDLPLQATGDRERQDLIVATLEEAFAPLMERDTDAFRRRFRKMAQDPFAFYRGSACLFYADVGADESGAGAIDADWVDEETRRVWIQGDLHAENYGTSMDGRGVFVFDVNDFDEAYLGHYTWDLLRCGASLALLGRRKAFPDDAIDEVVRRYVGAYLDQVRYYVEQDNDHLWALRLDNSRGAVRQALLGARRATRIGLLERDTYVEEEERRFHSGRGVRGLEDDERDRVLEAFDRYVETIPEAKRLQDMAYAVKGVVGRSGFGIGSAGLRAYNILVEGRSQALENDVVLSMKEGNVAAPSRVVDDSRLAGSIEHHGHRTAVSQRALQAFADPYLGWTELDGVGYVVSELSPYENDLAWSDVAEPADMADTVEQLGRATAKVHCVADADAEAIAVEGQVEDAVSRVVGERSEEFARYVAGFAESYAQVTRRDHKLFVDAFRSGAFSSVSAARR